MMSLTVNMKENWRGEPDQDILRKIAQGDTFQNEFLRVFEIMSALDLETIRGLFALLAKKKNCETTTVFHFTQANSTHQVDHGHMGVGCIQASSSSSKNSFDDILDRFTLPEPDTSDLLIDSVFTTDKPLVTDDYVEQVGDFWCSQFQGDQCQSSADVPSSTLNESVIMSDNFHPPDATLSERGTKSPKPLRRTVRAPLERVCGANETIFQILGKCVFTPRNVSLDQKQLIELQIAADCMFLDNCRQSIQSLLPYWLHQNSVGHHALGLPSLNRTPEAAAGLFNFIRSHTLHEKALEIRFAQATFYLIYLELCRDMKSSSRRPMAIGISNSARPSTVARDLILQSIHGNDFQYISRSRRDSGRQAITSVLRWGGRWWKLASCLGLGVLLLASEEVAIRIRDEDFLMAQVDGLITYIRTARPGTLSVFRSVEAETKMLMFGEVCNDLIDVAQDDVGGLLSERSICNARREDEVAISKQTAGNEWRVVRTDEVAKEVAAGFFLATLHNRSGLTEF